MPIIIYLDTQDYICLHNKSPDDQNLQVLKSLLASRDRGEVIFGFSFVNIIEFITKPDEKYRKDRELRGRLIKSICGNNAFPYPTDLTKGATFPNKGIWLNLDCMKEISASAFREKTYMQYKNMLKQEDRIDPWLKQMFSGRAGMTSFFKIFDDDFGHKKSDWGNLPVSQELLDSGVLLRLLKGKCSNHEFERHIRAWAFDPENFSRIFYEYSGRQNVMTEHFEKTKFGFGRLVNLIRDQFAVQKRANDLRLNLRTALVAAGVKKSVARDCTKQQEIKAPDTTHFMHNIGRFLGKKRVGHFEHYLKSSPKRSRNYEESDAIDLIHLVYAYDCDLFRCDKDMADVLKDYLPLNGKLVSRFTELPDRIDELLRQRASMKPG